MNFTHWFCAALLLLAPPLLAQVPSLLNYQGRVAVGTPPVNFDGSGSFKFALVDADGTTTYWSNDGTSTTGDEPTNAVSLAVAKGLYSVLLGDVALTNMTAVPASIFSIADVRLRVWFDDGTNGSQLLAPDQRIAAVGYAMVAADVADGAITSAKIATAAVNATHLAPASITGDHVAAGTLDFSKLVVPVAPGVGQVLGFDGSSLNWTAPGGGSSVWTLNGTSAYYNGGRVGIGTSAPAHTLSIGGAQPTWTLNGWGGALELTNASAIAWRANAGGARFGIGHTNGGLAFFRTASDPGTAGSPALYDMFLNDAACLCLGTLSPNPGYLLAVNGGVQFTPGGPGGTMQFGTPNSETGMTWTNASTRADLRFDGSTVKLLAGPAGGPPGNTSGIAVTTAGNVGIGTTSPGTKLAVLASGNAIYGSSTGSGEGVHGQSGGSSAGVNGTNSSNGPGVYGTSASGYAGYFAGPVAVTGDLNANSVRGYSQNGLASVYGRYDSPTGWAGFFQGNVNVTGTLSKGAGSFKIDHPLDPANKFLYHSFVESPDMMNIYNGIVTTDAHGEAVVTMPDYFEALNRDFRYQLTAIGQFAQAIVGSKMKQRRFTIKTDKPNVEVSWQVTGVRQDAYAKMHPIVVEVDKAEHERGRYLAPAAFGEPEEKQIGDDTPRSARGKGRAAKLRK